MPFPTTFWTTIRQHPEVAREKVFRQYHKPILNYVRGRGLPDQEAEDLAQDVFLLVCKEEFLRRADQKKGKFRSLLLGVTRHLILKAGARKGRRREVSLDPNILDECFEEPGDPDPEFERCWDQNLVQLALRRLMEDQRPDGPRYYEALILSKLKGLSYAQIAENLSVKEGDVANWVHQARKKVQLNLIKIVDQYCSSESERRCELDSIRRQFD